MPSRPAASGSRADLKKVAMPKTHRAVTPVILLCGMLLLFFSVSPAQISEVRSTDFDNVLPQSTVHRSGHKLSAATRDLGAKRRTRSQVTANGTPSPTQVPQFFDTPLYPISGNFGAALTADFNGDGKPDLLMGPNILLGNGDGTFQAPNPQVVASGFYESVAVGDFNNDGKLDLAVGVHP